MELDILKTIFSIFSNILYITPEITERLKKLASLIYKHNILYHQKDRPQISDKDFDVLVKTQNQKDM